MGEILRRKEAFFYMSVAEPKKVANAKLAVSISSNAQQPLAPGLWLRQWPVKLHVVLSRFAAASLR